MKTPGPLVILCCAAAISHDLCSEDWERIAAETAEPGFAMRIVEITPGSQAEALGLEVGDYVYQVGDRAMRNLSSLERAQEELLFFCRKNGGKATAVVQPGRLGVHYEEALRPQISFLRGEIGSRNPRWDRDVVEALSKLESDPKSAESLWNRVKALDYPDDELDAFLKAYCGWRDSREIPLRATFDKIAAEFQTMPRLYAALLEDMAFTTGETEVLRQLHAMDPASSQLQTLMIEGWGRYDSSPLPRRSPLDEARARRGRDLRDELTAVARESRPDMENQLPRLRQLSRFAPKPGHFGEARFRLPEDVRDFHYSVSFECVVPERHESFVSEVRISASTDAGRPDDPGSRLLTRIAVQSHRWLPTIVNVSSAHGVHGRLFKRPESPIPVLDELAPGAAAAAPAEFRLDIVRLGREIAAYCNGFAYCRLPVDPAVPNSDLSFFTCGIDAKPTQFEVWSLATETTTPGATRNTSTTKAGSETGIADELRIKFEAAYLPIHQPIADLDRSYSEALNRLLAAETEKGNLDAVLQVRKEIEGFGDGSGFSTVYFTERKASHVPLEVLRSKYLSERGRLLALGRKDRERLLADYRGALVAAQEEQTRLGNLAAAFSLREALGDLRNDPRFEEPPPEGSILANLHLVAKGEVSLWHNGEPLLHDDASPEPGKYVIGTSNDLLLAPGDVIHLRMRSNVVYRSFVVAIESKGGSVVLPVALEDIRYLGVAGDAAPAKTDAGAVLKVQTRPEKGRPDDEMTAMWLAMPLSAASHDASEWVKSGPGADWHDYAIAIRKEMFQRSSAKRP